MNSDNERRAAPCEVPPERNAAARSPTAAVPREPRMPERHPLEPLSVGGPAAHAGQLSRRSASAGAWIFLSQPAKRHVADRGPRLFGDRHHFLRPDRKAFDRERIASFCAQCGIALYDTAEVIRLKRQCVGQLSGGRARNGPCGAAGPHSAMLRRGHHGQRKPPTYAVPCGRLRGASGGRKRGLCAGRPHPCVSIACPRRRGLIPGPWSGKRSSTGRCSPHAACCRVRSAAGGRSMSREFAGG